MLKIKIAAFFILVPLLASEARSESIQNIYFSQEAEPLSGPAGHVYTLQPGQGVPKGLNVIEWDKDYPVKKILPENRKLTQAIAWDVGDFTGFHTTDPANQVGFPNSQYGGTAVQISGNTIGIYIDSKSLLDENGFWPKGPMPLMVQCPFQKGQVPFSEAGSLLQGAFDLQVPYSRDSNHASPNQIVVYFGFKDKVSHRSIAYGAQVWDSRGKHGAGNWIMFDKATRASMVLTPISSGGLYNTPITGSSGFQSDTWLGYKHFVFAISDANLRNGIKAINAKYKTATPFSEDLADYECTGLAIDSESEYYGSPASFGYSIRNIQSSRGLCVIDKR